MLSGAIRHFRYENPKHKCHGLRGHEPEIIDPQSPLLCRIRSTCESGIFVEIVGKMVDTLNRYQEMLRVERILNHRLRNTIEILNDNISHEATRIKELEIILELTGKEKQANVDANFPI